MKKFLFFQSILFLPAIFFFSCSAAFSAGVQGKVVDFQEYEANPKNGAIRDVRVYLYLDSKQRDSDFNDWKESGLKPEDYKEKSTGKELDKRYVGFSTTNDSGEFTLSSIWWMDYFPKYGTDASVSKGYFLFYHRDYGMVLYPHTILLKGDSSTQRFPPFSIKKAINETRLTGRVVDANLLASGQPVGIAGVTLRFFLPTEWRIEGDEVVVENDKWNTAASYTAKTDAEGCFSQLISYRVYLDGSATAFSKTKVRIILSMPLYSPFCLTTEANEKFSGYQKDGSIYPHSRTLDLADPTNWVLLDGSSKEVSYYDFFTDSTFTETIGRDSSDYMKADFDLDADGHLDAYYELTILNNGSQRDNIQTLPDFHLRKIALKAQVVGQVLSSGSGVNNANILFKWFTNDQEEIASVTSTKKVFGTEGTTVEDGHYSALLNLTCYNYSTHQNVAMPVYVEAKKDSLSYPLTRTIFQFAINGTRENSQNIELN